MAFKHGKDTIVKVGDEDISKYCNSTEWTEEAEGHEVTTYGNKAVRRAGGLKDGSATIEGYYESKEDGPEDVIRDKLGEIVELIFRPEGDGEDKPQSKVDALVTSYEQTNEVEEMITWSAEFEFDGEVDHSKQDDD